MTWKSKLRSALHAAEHSADSDSLDDVVWMLGGFPSDHPARACAEGLPRLQHRLEALLPCRSEIHTVLRVVTHRSNEGHSGTVANALIDMLSNPTRR